MAVFSKHTAEVLYGRMPVALQSGAFSLYGFKLRGQRYGRYFHQKLQELKSSEWWSAEQIQDHQQRKLGEMLLEVYQHVPYYQELFDSAGLDPSRVKGPDDLKSLPLLTKQDVYKNHARLINELYPRQQLHQNLTSGTSGTPLRIFLTREALQFQWAVWWRHRARFGLHFGDKFLMFGARLPVPIAQQKPPFWRHNFAINQVYLSAYHLEPKWTAQVVEWLNRERFDFYTGYPSAMYALASQMQDQGLRLHNRPKYVATGSDMLLPSFERTIRAVFGVPVTEQYGMAEACGNFAKCEYGRFHLDFEFCCVELLPIPGMEHTKKRKIVFTGLANPAMPFVRYDIGDYCEVSEGQCQCGRSSLSIGAIDGRVEEFIRTPDGRFVMGINQVLEWAPGIREAQIEQNTIDRLTMRVVPGIEYDANRDHQILEQELRKRIGFDMEVNFVTVDAIARTKSGKFRAVISNLQVEKDAEHALRSAVDGEGLV